MSSEKFACLLDDMFVSQVTYSGTVYSGMCTALSNQEENEVMPRQKSRLPVLANLLVVNQVIFYCAHILVQLARGSLRENVCSQLKHNVSVPNVLHH